MGVLDLLHLHAPWCLLSHDYDDASSAPLVPKLTPEYPPPPTTGPIHGDMRLNAHRLRQVAQAVENWSPVDAALLAHGSNMTYRQITLLAQDDSDLYWAWAKEVLDIAMAVPTVNATAHLHGISKNTEHRDQFKALALFLKTHDTDYAETKKIEVKTSGSVEHRHVTQMANKLLTQDGLSAPELAERVREARRDRETKAAPVIEAEFEELDSAPEPPREINPAFRRKK